MTISKGTGAGARSATASASFKPISPQRLVPTGTIVRNCGGSGCPVKHRTDLPLSISLRMDKGFEDAAVRLVSAIHFSQLLARVSRVTASAPC